MERPYLASSSTELRVMMIDFNAYFASVEQQLNPSLRGRPVGVVPMMAESTCCIAASYEAKRRGVKTGTRVSEAKKLCPDIVLIEAQHAKYVKMHHRAVEVVDSLIPVDQVLSIDEMCCILTPRWQSPDTALALAQQVKHSLLRELGECMRTSVGIGSNRFMAKTASNLQKPDGMVILRAQDLPQALYRLNIEDLTGIGRNMGIRLRAHGIDTVEKLYQQTRSQLKAVWGGIGGEVFWDQLHGLDAAPRETNTRTLGHSHVLPPHERNQASAKQVLDRLTQKAGMRLRKMNYCTTAMHVFVGFMKTHDHVKRVYWEAHTNMAETDDTRQLLRTLHSLLGTWVMRPNTPAPLKVGVVLHGLIPRKQVTLSLFEDEFSQDSSAALNQTMDTLNQRFGKNTLYFATSHDALDSAPMRIAFNRIPDLDTES